MIADVVFQGCTTISLVAARIRAPCCDKQVQDKVKTFKRSKFEEDNGTFSNMFTAYFTREAFGSEK